METQFIFEEQVTIPLRGPIRERRRLLWRCPKDELEVPVMVRRGRVWRASACPLCGHMMPRLQAQRSLDEAFAFEAWERSHQALVPLVVFNQPTAQPTTSVPVTLLEDFSMAPLNGSTIEATATTILTAEESTGATNMLANAGKVVWNTVTTVAYGAGVLTGAALLWGAAEVAKRIVNKNVTPSEEQQ